jgi:predicted SAM-dependent methyltransferase
MYPGIIEWFVKTIQVQEFKNKRVLEIGSFDVNGSVRPLIESCQPQEYIGIDIRPGQKVNLVLSGEEIVDYFGPESFDVIVSTETLEHVQDWRKFVNNIKTAVKIGGYVYLTVCPPKMGKHEYPQDCWRFEQNDLSKIFQDFLMIRLEGEVYLKAQKIQQFQANKVNLEKIEIRPVL